MSVADVYLFCSTVSPACLPCFQFLKGNRSPIKVVRLDTKEARDRARNGKDFQIKSVPTLMVLYDDGNMQLFIGQQKVMPWMQRAIQTPPPPRSEPMEEESSEEEYEPVQLPPKKSKKSKKGKPSKVPSEPQPRPGNGGLYGGGKKNKKSKKKQEQQPEEEEEIVFLDESALSNRPPPPPTQGLMTGASSANKAGSGMSSIMQAAKQMEKDMRSTLGYNEADLPQSS